MPNILIEISSLTQLFYARTLIDAGLIAEKEKTLLLSDNTKRPEAWSALREGVRQNPGWVKDFVKVIDYNELIYPAHPARIQYDDKDPERHAFLKKLIGEEHFARVLVESIQVSPGLFLAQLYGEAAIDVFADGLMVYSPTRTDLPQETLERIDRVFYVDFLEGIAPFLLTEASPNYTIIPRDILKKEYAKASRAKRGGKKNIVIIGQYLSDIGVCGQREELGYYEDILDREYDRYGDKYNYVFRAHPAAIASHVREMKEYAKKKGLRLFIDTDLYPAECLYDAENTYRVASVFSTSLFSLAYLYGCEGESYFADRIYERLKPLENSNHVPAALCQIYFNINKGEKKLSPEDVTFALLLYSYATHPQRFRDIFYQISPRSLIENFSGLRDMADYNFIRIPLKRLEKLERQQAGEEPGEEITQERNQKFKDFRRQAEEAIDAKDYNLARKLFIEALSIRPGNTNCVRRLRAVTSPKFFRKILLIYTRKYRVI